MYIDHWRSLSFVGAGQNPAQAPSCAPAHHCSLACARHRIAHRRRAALQHTTAALLAAAATKPLGASANIGGADYVIGGARRRVHHQSGQSNRGGRRATSGRGPARAATDYGSIGEAFEAEDGAAAQQVQAYFRSGGGYDVDLIQAVTQNKGAYPKSVRKAGGAFLAATAATLESYNTGDFEKALVQYESALTILAGYCGARGRRGGRARREAGEGARMDAADLFTGPVQ